MDEEDGGPLLRDNVGVLLYNIDHLLFFRLSGVYHDNCPLGSYRITSVYVYLNMCVSSAGKIPST